MKVKEEPLPCTLFSPDMCGSLTFCDYGDVADTFARLMWSDLTLVTLI